MRHAQIKLVKIIICNSELHGSSKVALPTSTGLQNSKLSSIVNVVKLANTLLIIVHAKQCTSYPLSDAGCRQRCQIVLIVAKTTQFILNFSKYLE